MTKLQLSEKTREAFEQYLLDHTQFGRKGIEKESVWQYAEVYLDEIPFMSLLINFFDSVGIYIDSRSTWYDEPLYACDVWTMKSIDSRINGKFSESRTEALIAGCNAASLIFETLK